MGRFTKRLIAGLSAALVVASGAFAQGFLLDDLSHGGNEHRMDNYWYYFVGDDQKLGENMPHNFIITNITGTDQYGYIFRPFEGESSDGDGLSAAMIFQNLDYADVQFGDDTYPVIGMGMLLSDDDDKGVGAFFGSVTHIEFWMKGNTVDTVLFKLETIYNSPTGPFGPTDWEDPVNKIGPNSNPANAYGIALDVKPEWTKYSIAVGNVQVTNHGTAISTGPAPPPQRAGDLYQQGWWGFHNHFNLADVTKIAWQVNLDKNSSASGAVYVDDIRLIGAGFNYIPRDQCHTCVGKPITTPNTLVSDFEENPDRESLLQNSFGYYWYAYGDDEAGGGSVLEGPWILDEHTGEDVLDVAGNGKDGGNGAKLDYILGPRFDQRGELIAPFVGIGTNLFDDEANSNYLDVTQATGIFFDYRTSFGATEFIAVEFSDRADVAQAGTTNGDDGQVFYTKLPGTGGAWQSAVVNFSDLVLPRWVTQGDRRFGTSLDRTSLGKIQFKYQGAEGAAGNISIDNLHILGTVTSVKHVSSKAAKAAGLRATYSRGVVGVNWNTASQVASGKISLVNVRGRTIASAPVVAGNRITANLGTGKVPAGMYFVRINAVDVNGKRIVQQVPITIVK